MATLLGIRWYLIGGLFAALVAFVLFDETHIHLLQHSLAEATKARDTAIALRVTEHNQAEALAKQKTDENKAQIDALIAKQTKTLADLKDAYASIARLRVDFARADKLRNDAIAAFARGRGDADTTAECQRRASSIGSVLSEALRTAEELAGDAEHNAADARSLLAENNALRAAWPK